VFPSATSPLIHKEQRREGFVPQGAATGQVRRQLLLLFLDDEQSQTRPGNSLLRWTIASADDAAARLLDRATSRVMEHLPRAETRISPTIALRGLDGVGVDEPSAPTEPSLSAGVDERLATLTIARSSRPPLMFGTASPRAGRRFPFARQARSDSRIAFASEGGVRRTSAMATKSCRGCRSSAECAAASVAEDSLL